CKDACRLSASLACILAVLLSLASCVGKTNSGTPGGDQVTISIQPGSASVAAGAQQQFSATVTGSTNTNITWAATGGTISSTGDYTAGANGGTFSITATSVADTSKSAQAAVTVSGPPPPPGTATSIS